MSHGQILPGETGKKHSLFLALISVAGGGVTIRHDGTLRTRRWRCVPTIDVEKPAEKKQGNDIGKISVSIGNTSSNGGFSTVDGSFSGWRIHLPRLLWDYFSIKRWLDFSNGSELCEIDSDLYIVDYLTWQKSHTHLKQAPSFFWFPKVYWK